MRITNHTAFAVAALAPDKKFTVYLDPLGVGSVIFADGSTPPDESLIEKADGLIASKPDLVTIIYNTDDTMSLGTIESALAKKIAALK